MRIKGKRKEIRRGVSLPIVEQYLVIHAFRPEWPVADLPRIKPDPFFANYPCF